MLIGGSGFIGSRFSLHLLGKGIQPVVVDWVHPSVQGVEYHPAELRMIADLTPGLLESVEAVFCLAWTTKLQAANQSPAYDLESNVLAGLHFLDGILRLKKRPRIIFLSSGGAVYGVPECCPTPESATARPIGAYGISKLVFEHYLELYRRHHELEYLVLRPANPYGEGQNPDASQGAVGVFLGRLARNEPIHIWGDGTVTRDYFYIADLTDAMMRALDYAPGLAGERIFNLGSGLGVSLNQLLEAIASVTGITPDVRYQPGRGFDVPSIVLDCARAETRLGWRSSTSLETGLAHTWKWIKTRWAQL
jgi:UDP-glucose 4-epimerase